MFILYLYESNDFTFFFLIHDLTPVTEMYWVAEAETQVLAAEWG